MERIIISKLTLYSTSSCPNCDVVKKQLNSAGIEYEISQDVSEMRSLGIRSVPALMWNDRIMFGNDIMKNVDEIKSGMVESYSKISVIKRNGNTVDFDISRIIKAVEKAMSETIDGVDTELSNIAGEVIQIELDGSDKTYTVEDIQDKVEQLLMDSNRKDVAKQYILYRDMRNKNRDVKESKYKLLDDEFISKYKHLPNPMSPLGEFVYYRTYSRWLPEEKRREYWWETCRRAVEFNCGLVENTTKEEAQNLFDNMFHLRQFLSGRTLWSGMTSTSYSNPTSQFNCSFAVIDKFSIYKDMCYLLMLGVGFGFSVENEYIQQLPKVRNNIQIIHKTYNPLVKHKRKEITDFNVVNSTIEISVGDSKCAWSNAIDLFLRVFYEHDFKTIDSIILNYDSVRPFGETLKTFGGKASGHDALLKIIDKIYKVLIRNNTGYKKLKSIDAMDIANSIAEGIVVGGTRRSAQMCLFDADDKDVMDAKTNLYTMDDKGIWSANPNIIHRMMSNNSVAYHSKPSFEDLKKRFETIKVSAEGNFFNMEVAKQRKPNAKGTNPCQPLGEYILTKDGFKKIEDITNNIYLNGKSYLSTNMFSTGKKEVFEVELENGSTIRMTGNHKISTPHGDTMLEKLTIGSKVQVDYTPIFNTGVDDEDEYNKGILTGWFLADGGYTKHHHENDYMTGFCVGKDEFEYSNKLENLIQKYIDEDFQFVPHHQKPETCLVGRVYKQDLNLNFRNNILQINKWNKWNFSLENKDKNFKLGFIRSVFTCDGSSRSNSPTMLCSKEKDFLKMVQRTLMEFGVYANLTIHNNARAYIAKDNKQRNNSIMYKLEIYDVQFLKIGYLTDYKQTSLTNKLIKTSYKIESKKKEIKIKNIISLGEMEVYDITVDKVHHYNTNGLVVHNCGEILLDSMQFCNLTTINLMGFVENGVLNVDKLLEAQKLSARAGYRNATVELELTEWNRMQSRDRLIGCSFTGYRDMVNATNITLEEEKILLVKLKEVAIQEADEYADELGLNRSELKTCLKPEGTLSLLPTVSSGGHDSHSPFYIRRIRINATDPLAKVCEELGYRMHPENGEQLETCKTKVIEFPVKSPNGKTKYDVSAIEQLERYKMFMDNYIEHNASNTISVRTNEWDEVVQWVYDNWNSIIGITFISLDDNFYQLLPYEAITEDEYNQRANEMKPFIPSLISKYEIVETELDIGNETCSSGSCGIR